MLEISSRDQPVSLCELLDRILNKGAVIAGEVTISVADIELVYLGLQLLVASTETARGIGGRTCATELRQLGDERT